ncbi:TPA_asm: hypothetical protein PROPHIMCPROF_32 [Mycobacterium phage McProf]|uniref:hypothetical protein n=1 Tax=Mycobacteroides chelonae TaxID=1774 RepID=UPI000AD88CCC|nr:hypothetical protein [Mycobacteroides chelonae]VEG15704.1 Uncharacterised protein [Mycolicibacterium phlei]DAZ90020.1 TPA_asm: hypothetical protein PROPHIMCPROF_32 [Mycobacterium phage McProf]
MRMKRALLIQAIDDALKAHEDDKDRYSREVKEWNTRREGRWYAQSQPRWRALRDMITQKIRHNETITNAEIERAMGASNLRDHAWYKDKVPLNDAVPRVRPVDVVSLTALRRTLEAIAEDEVSSAQLERLGFRKLYDVFRAAAGV